VCVCINMHLHAMRILTTAVIPIRPGQKWYNELGSTMIIETYDAESGVFSGKYESKVGNAESFYTLTGRRDTDGNTIGWTVNWQNGFRNAHSVTTWSGQLQQKSFGDPMILTTWLLTTQTEAGDNWDSTKVGKDEFSTKAALTGKHSTCIVPVPKEPPQDCLKMYTTVRLLG